MILIEVLKLIVDIDETFHLLWNLKNDQIIHTFRNRYYQTGWYRNTIYEGRPKYNLHQIHRVEGIRTNNQSL